MNISQYIEFVINSELLKLLDAQQVIKTGDVLKGTVIDFIKQDLVLIDFGSFRARAEVNFDVQKGQKIDVEVVEKNDNVIKLKLNMPEVKVNQDVKELITKIEVTSEDNLENLFKSINEFEKFIKNSNNIEVINKFNESVSKNEIPMELKQNIENQQEIVKESIIKAVEKVKTFSEPIELSKLEIKQEILNLVPKLKALIKDSGIFFEKNLENEILSLLNKEGIKNLKDINPNSKEFIKVLKNDVKPELLFLKKAFENIEKFEDLSSKKEVKNLKQNIENLLDNINLQQKQISSKSQSSEPYQVITFTLPFKETRKNGKLKVYYNKKKSKNKNQSYRISLLLDFDLLGELRIDLFQLKQRLSLSFFVLTKEVKDYIDNNLEVLKKGINDIYDDYVINVFVSKKKIKEFENEEVEIISDRLVDIKV